MILEENELTELVLLKPYFYHIFLMFIANQVDSLLGPFVLW